METIIKRDGKLAEFDEAKITDAIEKASNITKEFDAKTAQQLTRNVIGIIKNFVREKQSNLKAPSIEEIQDIVEQVLLSSEYKQTAKAYILYREQHKKLRDFANNASVDMTDDYLKEIDWKVNENSNMGYSIQGLNNYIASNISKSYWLNKIYPDNIKDAHLKGDIHIHDLNILASYCVGWDLKDLLMEGFTGVEGKVQSAPAKHFRTALGQIVNFMYTLQGEAAGAQAFSNFDTLLAPFVRYDRLNYDQVHQAMQEFVFNMNVPTRVGFQTPFSNITMDLTVPSYYKDQGVIIGGEIMEETYGDFQEEMNMINKAFFDVMMRGDASGRVFTFPIPTYNITKDFDWNNKDLDGLWEITAKYGIPNFSNFVNSDLNPEDARSMCCRLRIDNRQLAYRGGGLFGSNPLTGSIGVVTINLPKIGYQAKNEEEFFKMLSDRMLLAKESLEIKRKLVEKFTENNLYPYTKYYLRDIHARFKQYWKNHFSTIGLIGMNEACLNLFGENITTEKGHDFAIRVMDFMRAEITKYQEETGNNYNLEATPAEGTTYRLAKLDKETYPDIITANDGGEPYYTNSTHVPVNYTDDVFELLDMQDELQTKYTGGTTVHVFAGERCHNNETMKNFVKKVCENYKLPYFTFSPTFSICPNHGYVAGEHEKCPTCGDDCEIYSRVVGFIRPVKQWNKGKKAEFKNRKTFDIAQGLEKELEKEKMSFKLAGVQKTTFIDYPEKIACIVFTQGCNFRCGYCHNPELFENKEPVLSVPAFFDFLNKRKGKLDGIVITGGEPTLHGKDLIEFIKEVKSLGFLVKLDTNGTHPEVLQELLNENLLDYIAMDIKAPLTKYKDITRVDIDTDIIKKSIDMIMNSGVDHEFRTTIVKSQLSVEDLRQIGELIRGAKKYYMQKFLATKILDESLMNESSYTDEEFKNLRTILEEYVDFVDYR